MTDDPLRHTLNFVYYKSISGAHRKCEQAKKCSAAHTHTLRTKCRHFKTTDDVSISCIATSQLFDNVAVWLMLILSYITPSVQRVDTTKKKKELTRSISRCTRLWINFMFSFCTANDYNVIEPQMKIATTENKDHKCESDALGSTAIYANRLDSELNSERSQSEHIQFDIKIYRLEWSQWQKMNAPWIALIICRESLSCSPFFSFCDYFARRKKKSNMLMLMAIDVQYCHWFDLGFDANGFRMKFAIQNPES